MLRQGFLDRNYLNSGKLPKKTKKKYIIKEAERERKGAEKM